MPAAGTSPPCMAPSTQQRLSDDQLAGRPYPGAGPHLIVPLAGAHCAELQRPPDAQAGLQQRVAQQADEGRSDSAVQLTTRRHGCWRRLAAAALQRHSPAVRPAGHANRPSLQPMGTPAAAAQRGSATAAQQHPLCFRLL